jgi:hypothetical protein
MVDRRFPVVVPDPARAHNPFPLTDMQKLLLVGASDGMENSVRPHLYLEWESAGLDIDRYRRALNTALERHLDALVIVTPDLLLQRIPHFRPVPIEVADLAGCDLVATERALEGIRNEMAERPLPSATSSSTWSAAGLSCERSSAFMVSRPRPRPPPARRCATPLSHWRRWSAGPSARGRARTG